MTEKSKTLTTDQWNVVLLALSHWAGTQNRSDNPIGANETLDIYNEIGAQLRGDVFRPAAPFPHRRMA